MAKLNFETQKITANWARDDSTRDFTEMAKQPGGSNQCNHRHNHLLALDRDLITRQKWK